MFPRALAAALMALALSRPAAADGKGALVKELGQGARIDWTPLEPVPMTPTRLPARSTPS